MVPPMVLASLLLAGEQREMNLAGSRIKRWLGIAVAAALAGACAHSRADSAESLRKTADQFHKLVRWNDLRGAAELLTIERREAFLDEVSNRNDERDLKITDYELQDFKLEPGGKHATVISKVSWYRLPSVTQEEQKVVSHFVEKNGAWLISRQEKGPFAEALGTDPERRERADKP